jgi:hypothetical protein
MDVDGEFANQTGFVAVGVSLPNLELQEGTLAQDGGYQEYEAQRSCQHDIIIVIITRV